jgi:hypothetical protein
MTTVLASFLVAGTLCSGQDTLILNTGEVLRINIISLDYQDISFTGYESNDMKMVVSHERVRSLVAHFDPFYKSKSMKIEMIHDTVKGDLIGVGEDALYYSQVRDRASGVIHMARRVGADSVVRITSNRTAPAVGFILGALVGSAAGALVAATKTAASHTLVGITPLQIQYEEEDPTQEVLAGIVIGGFIGMVAGSGGVRHSKVDQSASELRSELATYRVEYPNWKNKVIIRED